MVMSRATARRRSPTRARYGGSGSIGGWPRLAQDIKKVEVLSTGARHGGGLEDRGGGLPAFIVVDDKGNDFFAEVTKLAQQVEKVVMTDAGSGRAVGAAGPVRLVGWPG